MQEARPLLERALALAEAPGEMREGVASASASLGLNEYYSGQYVAAEQHYNRSLTIFRKIYGGDHNPNVAWVLFRLAEVASEEQNYTRAEDLDRQALAIFAESQGPDGPKTAMAHAQLGHFLKCEKKYAEATKESELGYGVLVNQPGLPSEFLEMAKKDLAEEDKDVSSRRVNTH